MAKVVQVDGIGNVEFPDDMSDDDIGKAIAAQHPELSLNPVVEGAKNLGKGFVEGVNPFHGIGDAIEAVKNDPTGTLKDAALNVFAHPYMAAARAYQALKAGKPEEAAAHLQRAMSPAGFTNEEASTKMAQPGNRMEGFGQNLGGLVQALIAPEVAAKAPEFAADAANFAKAGNKPLAIGAAKLAGAAALAKSGLPYEVSLGLGLPTAGSAAKDIAESFRLRLGATLAGREARALEESAGTARGTSPLAMTPVQDAGTLPATSAPSGQYSQITPATGKPVLTGMPQPLPPGPLDTSAVPVRKPPVKTAFTNKETTGVQIPAKVAASQEIADALAQHLYDSGVDSEAAKGMSAAGRAQAAGPTGASVGKASGYSPSPETWDRTVDSLKALEKGGKPRAAESLSISPELAEKLMKPGALEAAQALRDSMMK